MLELKSRYQTQNDPKRMPPLFKQTQTDRRDTLPGWSPRGGGACLSPPRGPFFQCPCAALPLLSISSPLFTSPPVCIAGPAARLALAPAPACAPASTHLCRTRTSYSPSCRTSETQTFQRLSRKELNEMLTGYCLTFFSLVEVRVLVGALTEEVER